MSEAAEAAVYLLWALFGFFTLKTLGLAIGLVIELRELKSLWTYQRDLRLALGAIVRKQKQGSTDWQMQGNQNSH